MEWTAERRIELGSMWMAGRPRGEIARHFGSTVLAVQSKAWRLGLPDLKEVRKGATGIMRPCMCCEQVFFSEGKHNRLCEFCKSEH